MAELMKAGGGAVELALLMAAVYGAGIVSMGVLVAVGLSTALREGRRVGAAYLVALGAVLAELARIGLKA